MLSEQGFGTPPSRCAVGGYQASGFSSRSPKPESPAAARSAKAGVPEALAQTSIRRAYERNPSMGVTRAALSAGARQASPAATRSSAADPDAAATSVVWV